ncbi:MAG TPA: hypothetical protein VFX21_04025 [Acidimicrobiia bacterium]|nr:hypothetical protein [Acidimicrobiia bacterium]
MTVRRALVLLVVVFLVGITACSGGDDDDSSASTAPGSTTTTFPPLMGTIEVGELQAPDRCDPIDQRHCLLPFPSDTFTVADETTETGRRVALSRDSMPTNKDGVHVDPREWNRNDGFSPGQPISIYVAGLDVAQSHLAPSTDIGSSLADDAPIVLLDATTGERHPYWSELDASVGSDDARVLYIRPAVNYPDGHRMIVALRGLKDASGAAIEPSAVFRGYRDRLDTKDVSVEARRPRYEQVFGDLEDAGVERDDLYAAWDFTVASTQNLTERMLTIRDDAFADLGDDAPSFTIDAVEEHPEGLFRRVTGTVQVPLYLTGVGDPGSSFHYGDGENVPSRNGTESFGAGFICNIPEAARTQPARLSLYGHGLLGSNDEVNAGNVRAFAQEHDIVFCATKWIGMSEDDIPNAVAILQDLSKFPTLADRAQQGFLNALFLGRLMQSDAFANDPNLAGLLDTSALYYDGNSQGAIMGGALTAVSQDFTRSVLGVTGMNYSTLLQRSIDWDTYRAVYDPAYPDEIERGIGISLIQMLWDRAEANGYANHMTGDPLPDTPEHTVLLHVALGDHQVANVAAEVEARTIGARIHCPATTDGRLPDVEPHWDLECAKDGDTGSVLVWWDSGTPPAPPVNLAPSGGEDPHGDPRSSPDARTQKSEFLQPDGTFVDVCNGQACTAAPS